MNVRHVPRALSRRHFLQRASLGVAAAAVLPRVSAATDDEKYWRVVRDQFPIRRDFTLMNAGNLCPSPYSVSAAVSYYTRNIDTDPSMQNRKKFEGLAADTRAALARYVGADPGEIAIVRNTTEGNNQVITGLDLGPGDEVVIWDQNHPSNAEAWDVRAARHGFSVHRVTTPDAPPNEAALLVPFAEGLTQRTRVLAFSHVSNISGVALPAVQLCAMARERGVLTLIDGAQTFGAHRLDLHALGCDFYTGSAHKWFMGPKEGGLLYARREAISQLWPAVVGVGWNDDLTDAQKFETLGQRDDAMIVGIKRTVEFLESIGRDVAEARTRALAIALKRGFADSIGGVTFRTPHAAALSGGVVVFALPGVDHEAAFESLYRDHNIGGALIGGDHLRLCPHLYNTMDEVRRVIEVLGRMA